MPLGIITLEDVLEGLSLPILLSQQLTPQHPELIGEEIYDEFDPEGGHAAYVPAEVCVQTDGSHLSSEALRKKESAPQLSRPGDLSTDCGSTVGSKSLTNTPVLKPIAIRGLSFLTNRSRSAPPTPRDQKPSVSISGAPSPPRTTAPPMAESTLFQGGLITSLSPALEDEDETTQQIPPIILEQTADVLPPTSSSVEGSDALGNNANKTQTPPGSGSAISASAMSGQVAVSRSVSPAPSLEAILLDRKRRLVASGAQSSTVTPAHTLGQNFEMWVPTPRIASPGIKGARFKSSPLGGGDSSGMVIAERVKENLQSQGASLRIPNDKDKAGPDKGNSHGGPS